MPVHDWTRVDAGIFHDFHQSGIISLRNDLNGGLLPTDYYAMAEQVAEGPIPDSRLLYQCTAGTDLSRSLARRSAALAERYFSRRNQVLC